MQPRRLFGLCVNLLLCVALICASSYFQSYLRYASYGAYAPGAATPLTSGSFSYTDAGNLDAKTKDGAMSSYGYDGIGRVTHGPEGDYSYDASGNRLRKPGDTADATIDSDNKLTGDATHSYAYDDNGAMVTKTAGGDAWNYVYDVAGRLVEVQKNGAGVASYQYDPWGRRLWKEAGGVRTYFAYSDEGLAGEFDAGGTQRVGYGYKPGSWWTNDPVFMKRGGNYYFLSPDPLGHAASMSLYDYCSGDPVNGLDPDGRFGKSASYSQEVQQGYDNWMNQASAPVKYSETQAQYESHFIDSPTSLDPSVQSRQVYSNIAHATPIVGTAISLWEVGTGRDVFTGNQVSTAQAATRAILSSLVLAPEGGGLAEFGAIDEEMLVANPLAKNASLFGAPTANRLATEANQAVFWSGIEGSDKAAAAWVAKNGGATLETTLKARSISLPQWNANDPAVVAAWRQASLEFAQGASGNVKVLQPANAMRYDPVLGKGSVWSEVEWGALKANPNVQSRIGSVLSIDTILHSGVIKPV